MRDGSVKAKIRQTEIRNTCLIFLKGTLQGCLTGSGGHGAWLGRGVSREKGGYTDRIGGWGGVSLSHGGLCCNVICAVLCLRPIVLGPMPDTAVFRKRK